jgi:HD-GYP domain-containing protein (c-di-GMP phosphodiesterase class II)
MQLDDLPVESSHEEPLSWVTPGTEPGKKGLEKLAQSRIALQIDTKLANRQIADIPVGKPLQSEASQIPVGRRSEEYKADIAAAYTTAVDNTRVILDALAGGNVHCGPQIRSLIERFIAIFKQDRNILLNIAGTDPRDDDYLFHHSLNVCLLSINIAAAAGYSENQVIEIGTGALLHDIGMLVIPRDIRNKQGRLSVEEWYEVQKHPIVGLHLLEKIKDLPESVLFIAYQVHERVNAKGYPKQRGGRLIHRYAKLVQIADIYEALTSPRPHRRALLPYQAAEGLVKMTRTNLVADDFVKAFLSYLSIFPIGSLVQLSNHAVAKVVEANPPSMGKPTVAILTDAQGRLVPKSGIRYVNLKDESELFIIKALACDYLKGVGIMDGF